jgi:hypothetical protein
VRTLPPSCEKSVQGRVKCGLARRAQDSDNKTAFRLIVNDEAGALTEVNVAVKTIKDRAAADDRSPVVVTPAIYEAVEAAVRAAHPLRWIISHPVVRPGASRHDPTDPEEAARFEDSVVSRAVERIAALRARS